MTRYTVANVETARIAALLRHRATDLMLDVGANTGQYATALREAGYAGHIVSFEPLSAAHAACARAASRDQNWEVAEFHVEKGHLDDVFRSITTAGGTP